MGVQRLDVIYVAASSRDGRFTRICVASIRYFYPDVPIKLLVGGRLEPRLTNELETYWNVGLADVPAGDWGWGFVKLEPLFGCSGERFLVLDSDTVFSGSVLEIWEKSEASFLVDDETQSEEVLKRLYYDWRKVAVVDSASGPPDFVFNSGQWFGTAGILRREDFYPFLDWSVMPPKMRHAHLFMDGDQGLLNYVLNQKARLSGLAVDRRAIMCWPAHGMENVCATSVATRTANSRIIHWAGMKRARLRTMMGADILLFFEVYYYSRLPLGTLRRFVAMVKYPIQDWGHQLSVRIRQRLAFIQTGRSV